jgi:hypothetical protein
MNRFVKDLIGCFAMGKERLANGRDVSLRMRIGNFLYTQSVSMLDDTRWEADKETSRETPFAFFNRPSVAHGCMGKRMQWRADLYLTL